MIDSFCWSSLYQFPINLLYEILNPCLFHWAWPHKFIKYFGQKKKTQRTKVDAFESEHYNIIKKNWPKLSKKELTYFFSLILKNDSCYVWTSTEKFTCSAAHQTEIRSKWICEIESPFLKPLQTEIQNNWQILSTILKTTFKK